MDSSHLNYPLLEFLVTEFPDAKFILTIRDCYSWLDSLLNHHGPLYGPRGKQASFHRTKWIRFYDDLFGAHRFSHGSAEQALADLNLYTLDGYFSYWAKHNRDAITMIPAHRLLIIKTQEIDQNASAIATFLQIPADTLSQNIRGNTRKASQKLHLLSKLEPEFVEEKAQQHCQELMAQFFPEIQNIRDLPLGKA
jgi:hypothetical protein